MPGGQLERVLSCSSLGFQPISRKPWILPEMRVCFVAKPQSLKKHTGAMSSGTKFMSAGAAYGHGIYMADQLSVSLGYASRGGSGAHWSLAKTKGEATILAVCEVIDK